MVRWFKSLFTRHRNCLWCDMPLPDCVCPISTEHVFESREGKSISHAPANDNHSHRFFGHLVESL